ncbi:MAG: hypothetical protein AB8G11_18590 [Saprospiraceae bacterium]
MNQLETYQSQIQKTDTGYTITTDSTTQRLSYQITPTMLIVSTVVLFISTMLSEVLSMILFLGLLVELYIYFYKYIFVTKISIDKAQIRFRNKVVILKNIQYLDIHIKVTDNNVKIRINNIEFKLKNASDIPILTDIIEKTANISFYENHQLSDGSEILTYKTKNIIKPLFPTFLTVHNTPDEIIIYDITKGFSWFKIKKNQAKLIRYSKPNFDELFTERIYLKTVGKLHVIIDNKAGVTKQYHQVSVLAVGHSYVFRSQLRNAKDELTNMRDGEKIYHLLKNLPSLANIKIEKQIINP